MQSAMLCLCLLAPAQAREGLTPPPPDLTTVLKKLDALSTDMQAMRQDLDGLLKDRHANVSLKQPISPSDGAKLTPPANGNGRPTYSQATGTVRVVNVYKYPEVVRLGGQEYTVNPGQVLSVPMPAGDFTYELKGTREPRTRVLHPDETYSLQIEDPPAHQWTSYAPATYRSWYWGPSGWTSYYTPAYASASGSCQ
jgi:hypothetical protein